MHTKFSRTVALGVARSGDGILPGVGRGEGRDLGFNLVQGASFTVDLLVLSSLDPKGNRLGEVRFGEASCCANCRLPVAYFSADMNREGLYV